MRRVTGVAAVVFLSLVMRRGGWHGNGLSKNEVAHIHHRSKETQSQLTGKYVNIVAQMRMTYNDSSIGSASLALIINKGKRMEKMQPLHKTRYETLSSAISLPYNKRRSHVDAEHHWCAKTNKVWPVAFNIR